MSKTLLAWMLLVLPALAQDTAEALRRAAGCGANEDEFTVKTDKKQRPLGQPQADKALVYVFGGEEPTKWGIDGKWAGASESGSYFFFGVVPGNHRICARMQSRIGSENKIAAALTLSAQPGQTYYVRAVTVDGRL